PPSALARAAKPSPSSTPSTSRPKLARRCGYETAHFKLSGWRHTPSLRATPLDRGDLDLRTRKSPLSRGAPGRAGCVGGQDICSQLSSPHPMPHATPAQPWWRALTPHHWFVFTVASLAWFFDCLD